MLRVSEARQPAPAGSRPSAGMLTRSFGGTTAAVPRLRARGPAAPAGPARPGSGTHCATTPTRS
eukprot:6470321-Pyramimonas_sp.AAC.1